MFKMLVYLLLCVFLGVASAVPAADNDASYNGTVLTNQGLANYFKVVPNINSSEACFAACVAIDFCAGAAYKLNGTGTEKCCYLVKHGFQLFNSSLFESFVRAAFLLESHVNLSDRYPAPHRVVHNVQFSILDIGSTSYRDALSPSACFDLCKSEDNCTSASFHTRSVLSYNCYLFTNSSTSLAGSPREVNDWVSFIKDIDSPINLPSLLSKSVNFTIVQNVTMVGGVLIGKAIVKSWDACFGQCELISYCAGATFIRNDSTAINCALFQYGFTQVATAPGILTVSYTRCRVSRDMENEADVTHADDRTQWPNDLILRGVTFEQVFATFRASSPTACFRNCSSNPKCVAATFLLAEPVNCELASTTSLCDSPAHNRTIAFVKNFYPKIDNKTESNKEVVPTWRKNVLANTTLTDHFERLIFNSSEQCFAHCDLVPYCAGASFCSPSNCFLHAYGFNQTEHVNVTAYVKPEVELINNDFFVLGEIKQGVQLSQNSTCTQSLLPGTCFEHCSLLSECRNATFVLRIKSPRTANCCFLMDADLAVLKTIVEITNNYAIMFNKKSIP